MDKVIEDLSERISDAVIDRIKNASTPAVTVSQKLTGLNGP